MNRQNMLALVAGHAAGILGASTFAEAVGPRFIVNEDDDEVYEFPSNRKLSKREVKALEWAIDQVQDRLYNMGKRPED